MGNRESALLLVVSLAACELVLDLRDDYYVPENTGVGGGGGIANTGGSSTTSTGGGAGSPVCTFATAREPERVLPSLSLRGLAADDSGVYVTDDMDSFVRKCPPRGVCTMEIWNKNTMDANMEPAPTALTLWENTVIFGHGLPTFAVSTCDSYACSSVDQVLGGGVAEVTSLAVAFAGGGSGHAVFWTAADNAVRAMGLSPPHLGWIFASNEPGAHSIVVDAEQNLYWATSKLRRCTASGQPCTPDTLADVAATSGLAHHAGRLYYASLDDQLMSCNAPDCSSPMTVTGGRPTHIAVDDCAIYWLDESASLHRCAHDRIEACDTLGPGSAAPPLGLALGPDRVYWTVDLDALYSHPK